MKKNQAKNENHSEPTTELPVVVALIVAFFGVLAMLIVDHGPWSRPKAVSQLKLWIDVLAFQHGLRSNGQRELLTGRSALNCVIRVGSHRSVSTSFSNGLQGFRRYVVAAALFSDRHKQFQVA